MIVLLIIIYNVGKVEFPGSDRKPLPKFFEHIKEMDQFSSLLAGASSKSTSNVRHLCIM